MKIHTRRITKKLLSHCARESGHSHFRTLKNKHERATSTEAPGRRRGTGTSHRRHDPGRRHRFDGERDARSARTLGIAVERRHLQLGRVDRPAPSARHPGAYIFFVCSFSWSLAHQRQNWLIFLDFSEILSSYEKILLSEPKVSLIVVFPVETVNFSTLWKCAHWHISEKLRLLVVYSCLTTNWKKFDKSSYFYKYVPYDFRPVLTEKKYWCINAGS